MDESMKTPASLIPRKAILRRGSFLFDNLHRVGEFGPGAPNEIDHEIPGMVEDEYDEDHNIDAYEAIEAIRSREGHGTNIDVWRFEVGGALWCALAAWYGMDRARFRDVIKAGGMSDKIRGAIIPENTKDVEYVYLAAGSDGVIQELFGGDASGESQRRFEDRFVFVDLGAVD